MCGYVKCLNCINKFPDISSYHPVILGKNYNLEIEKTTIFLKIYQSRRNNISIIHLCVCVCDEINFFPFKNFIKLLKNSYYIE